MFVKRWLRRFDRGDGSVEFAVAATVVTEKWFGANIPGQPAAPEHFADMWRYQSPLGKRVRLGAVLREAVNSYDPSAASLSGMTSAALDECDQLELRRLDSGDLRPVSTGEDFATDSLLAALADRDSETELQMILEVALPERDWVWAHLYWHVHLGRASHAGQSAIDCASTTSFGPAICIAGFTFAPRTLLDKKWIINLVHRSKSTVAHSITGEK